MRQRKRIRTWHLVMIGLVSACISLAANICVAKMSDSNESDQGSLDVAKWDVSIVGAGGGVNLVAGGSPQVYTLIVKNDSEVASEYVIELSNIPEGVWVGLDGGTLQEPDSENKVTFSENGGVLDLVEKTRQHSLRFSAELDAGAVIGDDIAIDVHFKQKEPEP